LRYIIVLASCQNRRSPTDSAEEAKVIDSYLTRASEAERRHVWSALRDQANHNRAFADAEWSLPEGEVEKLEAVVRAHQPDNAIDRFSWLFDDWTPDVPGLLDNPQGAIDTARREAIQQLLTKEGADGILGLAERVKLPHLIAGPLVECTNELDVFEKLIRGAVGRGDELARFAAAVSGTAAHKLGHVWGGRLKQLAEREGWSPDVNASLISMWPDERKTWTAVAEFGGETERIYWRRKYAFPPTGNIEDLEFVARQYMRFERSTAAIDALSARAKELPVSLLFELLDSAIVDINRETDVVNNMFSYHVEKIFKSLESNNNIQIAEIAQREYAYLPLLRRRNNVLTLHRLMAESAEFYVSVISDSFRSASAGAEEPTEEKRARARVGYQLLSSFKTVPGAKNNTIDFNVLRTWVQNVRKAAAEVDLVSITDQYIGHILAHSTSDADDGAWPNRAVRQLLDELESDDVERGLAIERFNMRGAHWKAMYEGGAQERVFSHEFRAWAKVMPEWPRAAALLERIATDWDRYADQEDIRAQHDKMRN